MTDDSLPDLSPTVLSRLVAGMTTDEVEAVVGRFHRPKLYEGREYFAWIGEGGEWCGPSSTGQTGRCPLPCLIRSRHSAHFILAPTAAAGRGNPRSCRFGTAFRVASGNVNRSPADR